MMKIRKVAALRQLPQAQAPHSRNLRLHRWTDASATFSITKSLRPKKPVLDKDSVTDPRPYLLDLAVGALRPPHYSALERNVERCAGLGANVVHCDAGMQFSENEAATLLHLEHAQVGDDEIDDSQTRDWQRAFFQNLRAAVSGAVLHHRHHALHSGDEVHRATGSFDHLAGNHPIRDVAFVRHLEGAENGEIDVPAANHRERVGAREESRAGHCRDGLLAGVDQVGVHLVLGRERADAEQAVLGL